jgi:acetolactate synthase I/II/III large subunit
LNDSIAVERLVELVAERLQWIPAADDTVGSAIMAILKLEGVRSLCCYPSNALINAAAEAGIRPVLSRQERVGVGIADGFSRVSHGRPPGVFAMQEGPGVENAYAGIATASSDSVPVLLLPGGIDDTANGPASSYAADRLRDVTKYVERVRSPSEIGAVMRRALSRLQMGRVGPVAVEVPGFVARMPVGATAKPYVVLPRSRPAGDPTSIDRAVDLIIASARPVIIAGQGVLYAEATPPLIEFAELIDAPVGTTLEGKSSFPETHPLSIGAGGSSRPEAFTLALDEADLVIGVGASFRIHSTTNPGQVNGPRSGSRIIQVTLDDDDFNNHCEVDCPVFGDAAAVLHQLNAAVRERTGLDAIQRGTAAIVARRRAEWLSKWRAHLHSDVQPINPYRVVYELDTLLDKERSIITHDSGSPRHQLVPFYSTSSPNGYLGWGKSHALGSGLGLIMGAKLACPAKVCVNVMGDAAFGMVGLDFETAVRNEIPIVTVVLNNSIMACENESLREAHALYGSRRISGDYAALARALGGWSTQIGQPGAVRAGLAEAIRQTEEGKPALVEVLTSPATMPVSE